MPQCAADCVVTPFGKTFCWAHYNHRDTYILTDSTSTNMKHVDVLQTQYLNSADLRSFLDTGSTQTHVYPC